MKCWCPTQTRNHIPEILIIGDKIESICICLPLGYFREKCSFPPFLFTTTSSRKAAMFATHDTQHGRAVATLLSHPRERAKV